MNPANSTQIGTTHGFVPKSSFQEEGVSNSANLELLLSTHLGNESEDFKSVGSWSLDSHPFPKCLKQFYVILDLFVDCIWGNLWENGQNPETKNKIK